MIYNSISDTCSTVFLPKMAVKWYVFDPKQYSNSFLLLDIMDNCVDYTTNAAVVPPNSN